MRRAPGDAGEGGGALVEATGDGLRLVPDAVEVDAAAIEAALADGSPERLEEASCRYAGDLLDGFGVDEEPFEGWRRLEAARLRTRTLQGLARLLARHVDAGDAEAAVEIGERLLAIDPTAEEAHRALMGLHLSRGALGAAMRQYERCRAALAAELGVVPSAETEALRRRLGVRHRPGPDRTGPRRLRRSPCCRSRACPTTPLRATSRAASPRTSCASCRASARSA